MVLISKNKRGIMLVPYPFLLLQILGILLENVVILGSFTLFLPPLPVSSSFSQGDLLSIGKLYEILYGLR